MFSSGRIKLIFAIHVMDMLCFDHLTHVSVNFMICIFSVTTVEGLRKRPLIVFDGNSTSTSIKVKKTENGAADRLKPPPAGSTTNTVRRLSAPSNASTYLSASSLSEDAKLGIRNNEAQQNNVSKTDSSVLTGLKVYPLSPIAGATVVKLKRSVPKEESDLPVCLCSILLCSFLFFKLRFTGARVRALQEFSG